jgi:GNAT superfamily N-acetyltransferase
VDELERWIVGEVPAIEYLRLTGPGVTGEVRIDMLRIRKDQRGKGNASRVVKMITAWADARQVVLTATPQAAPMPGERPAAKARLRRLYTRAGFRNTRGKLLGYSDSMFRDPTPHS